MRYKMCRAKNNVEKCMCIEKVIEWNDVAKYVMYRPILNVRALFDNISIIV